MTPFHRRPPCRIGRGRIRCRGACQQVLEFCDQLVEFITLHDPFEDVKARASVDLCNVLLQHAICIKLNGARQDGRPRRQTKQYQLDTVDGNPRLYSRLLIPPRWRRSGCRIASLVNLLKI